MSVCSGAEHLTSPDRGFKSMSLSTSRHRIWLSVLNQGVGPEKTVSAQCEQPRSATFRSRSRLIAAIAYVTSIALHHKKLYFRKKVQFLMIKGSVPVIESSIPCDRYSIGNSIRCLRI
ncbi:hypothetical protein CEXT_530921 [Caerostris extrusa]|uniref:Uncharacterized protein n=1 Tax=Caerostris extrusa TaxID=172846 RepID=A0AAV4P099_CAEEX|nr:hypothetical protein CEXT_530921 [Caerostris extrusa]